MTEIIKHTIRKPQGSTSKFPHHLLRSNMSSAWIALALNGIAMSANMSTSLKKTLSYRVVEIRLVINNDSQTIIMKRPLCCGAEIAYRCWIIFQQLMIRPSIILSLKLSFTLFFILSFILSYRIFTVWFTIFLVTIFSFILLEF